MPVRRALLALFTLYVAFTLGVFVPAHHHEHDHATETHAHHHAHDPGIPCHDADGGDHESNPVSSDHQDSSGCSICLFARALMAPPSFAATIPTLDVVNILPADAPSPVIHSSFVPTLYGRAPPVAA